LIDAVIFDMDGVLVDSEPFWRQAEIHAIARYGGHITEAQTRQTTGLRVDEVASYWIERCQLDRACHSDLCQSIMDEVIERIGQCGRLLPGVRDALEWLSRTDLRVGLASSSPLRLIEAVLQLFELHRYFSVRVSAEGLAQGKPHPQVYLEAAARLGVDPLHCLAIEDSVNGLIAAKAARMTAVCVPEPGQEGNPRFGIADIVLPSLERFPNETILRLLDRPSRLLPAAQ